ncbi:toll/interleukin-1 receptor (TIR) domain-containing protein [Artemisia annua]|uniref:Toll/interleukin-1 receptor (TIR) domain-containing protein n=1 Tax=Artemisia annua TaxID=35608 RepID=A0A2U1PSR1_ARTAN|nr:toll/interleukin-1 receptor (TIR) domain-containing protein [Artemisia annua]
MPDESLNLKYLDISHSKLKTIHLRSTPNLKTLILKGCNDLLELQMPVENLKLEELNLSHSKLKTIHLGNTPNLVTLILEGCNDLVELQMPVENLKLEELNLSHSKLKIIHVGNTPNLETLILEGCNDLVELQMPLENIKLEELNLSHSKLKTIHLGNTPNLELLILEGCNDLVELQMPVENLKLEELNLSHSKLKTIHLGNTPNLMTLILKGCNDLVELQMPVESLKLEDLNLSHSKLRILDFGLTPNLKRLNLENCNCLVDINAPVGCLKIGRLVFLEELNFSSTDIRILSDSICMLNQLKSLEIVSCWLLEKLPEDLGRLQCLEKLILTDCKVLQDLPNSICKMKSLISLHLDECRRIMKLPEEIGRLDCLQELDMTRSGISCLPTGIFQLKGLRIVGEYQQLRSFGFTSEIQISENKATVTITGTQSSSLVSRAQRRKRLNWSAVQAFLVVPTRSNVFLFNTYLTQLDKKLLSKILELGKKFYTFSLRMVVAPQSSCDDGVGTQATKCLYFDSPGFSAEIAVKGLAHMKDLRFIYVDLLEVYSESNIVEFDKVCEYLPSSLRFMTWSGFPFSSLPNTFQGKYLVGLEISASNIVQLWEDGEEKVLHKLRFLTISSSKLRTFDLRLAPNLEQLAISECYDFVEFHMPAESLKLKHLVLSYSKFTNLHLRSTPNLEILVLYRSKLRTLDFGNSICKLKHLKYLEFRSCFHLVKLPEDIGRLESLETLILTDRMLLQDLPNSICNMKCLNELSLRGCIRVVELPEDIGCLEGLKKLNIFGTGITRLPESIFRLRGLCIVGSIRLIDTYSLLLKKQRTDIDDIVYYPYRSNHDETVCYI